ncbi:hypothetical protein GCM10017784_10870 [Deinococcus indicus]|nr:hypothetical protein GCM10017784_10870 [Deinococcus indicus]
MLTPYRVWNSGKLGPYIAWIKPSVKNAAVPVASRDSGIRPPAAVGGGCGGSFPERLTRGRYHPRRPAGPALSRG